MRIYTITLKNIVILAQCWFIVVTYRLRRWTNICPTMVQRPELDGFARPADKWSE